MDYLSEPPNNHKDLFKRETKRLETGDDVMTEAKEQRERFKDALLLV